MPNWEKVTPEKIKTILVMRYRSVAEILSTTPLLKILVNYFPAAKIDFLMEEIFNDLFTDCPFINEVLLLKSSLHRKLAIGQVFKLGRKIRKRKYDLIIDLQNDQSSRRICFLSKAVFRVGASNKWWGKAYNLIRKPTPVKKHLVLSNLDIIKGFAGSFTPVEDDLKLFIAKSKRPRTPDRDKKIILLYPGGDTPSKLWPEYKYAQLADTLLNQYGRCKVLLVGQNTDKERKRIDSITQMMEKEAHVMFYSFYEKLVSLLDRADIFIGSEDGPMHIAAALNKKVVALFGPSDPHLRHPWGSGHEVVWHKLPCAPCEIQECRKKEYCMNKIETAEVLEAVRRFFK